MDVDVNGMLGRDNPFLFFVQQAKVFQAHCQFPSDFASEAIDIIKASFGEAWIREQLSRRMRAGPFPFQEHPIARALGICGEPQVAELLELAVYCKTLHNVPGLSKVLQQMRNAAQYETSLLQLAHAHRFAKVGACDVELEPSAAQGRVADIAFGVHGYRYLVECYEPRHSTRREPWGPEDPGLREVETLCNKVLGALIPVGDERFVAFLRVTRQVSPAERKRLAARCLSTVSLMKSSAEAGFQDAACEFSVRRVTTREMEQYVPGRAPGGELVTWGDANFILTRVSVSATEMRSVQEGGEHGQLPRAMVLVWAPMERGPSFEERLNSLTDKISTKLVQTRRVDGPRRLIIISLPEAKVRTRRAKEAVASLGQRLIDRHRGLAGVLLVTRAWMTSFRYGYVGYSLPCAPADDPSSRLFEELAQLEADHDFLGDHQSGGM